MVWLCHMLHVFFASLWVLHRLKSTCIIRAAGLWVFLVLHYLFRLNIMLVFIKAEIKVCKSKIVRMLNKTHLVEEFRQQLEQFDTSLLQWLAVEIGNIEWWTWLTTKCPCFICLYNILHFQIYYNLYRTFFGLWKSLIISLKSFQIFKFTSKYVLL